MQGQIAVATEKDTVNSHQSRQWLAAASGKRHTETLITACQDQACITNYIKLKS